MSEYTIRVELEGSPTREEYDALHLKMKGLGFLKAVNGVCSGEKVVRNLPTGLYYGPSDKNVSSVAEAVDSAARGIRKVVGVFVAQTETWSSRP